MKPKTNAPRLTAILGAIALGAAGSAFAGEALDIELPSMRTPIVQSAAPAPAAADSAYTSEKLRAWYHEGEKSRAEVRAELKAAREAGALSRGGEITDTPKVLAARAKMNAEQHDAIVAEYAAESDRMLAEAEAEAALMAFAAEPVDEQAAFDDQTALAEPLEPPVETAMLPSDASSSALFDETASEPQLTAADESESDTQLALGGAETGIAPAYESDLTAAAPSDETESSASGDLQVASAE